MFEPQDFMRMRMCTQILRYLGIQRSKVIRNPACHVLTFEIFWDSVSSNVYGTQRMDFYREKSSC